jgi:hypothetical protein
MVNASVASAGGSGVESVGLPHDEVSSVARRRRAAIDDHDRVVM